MSRLNLQPTSMAHWHALVNEAEFNCSLELGEDLESYLVFLLMRFSEKPEFCRSIMALEFLEGLNASGNRRLDMLKEVGDKCLLFSGLFPEQVKRRRLKSSYYIDLGQNAYYVLSSVSRRNSQGLYSSLCEGFLSMHRVLASLRQQACVILNQNKKSSRIHIAHRCYQNKQKQWH